MVLRIAFQKVFSRLPRDLENLADRNSIPENQLTTFHPIPDCSNTAEVPSFTLRTALSAMPFVPDR